MTLDEAKNAAWFYSRKWKQDMYVVQRGGEYFLSSPKDLSSGITPVATYTYRAKKVLYRSAKKDHQ